MMAIAQKWVATDFGGPEFLREIDVEAPPPAPGEVTIKVRAAGMNPADYKVIASGTDRSSLPLSIGFEVAGEISALGPGAQIASGGGKINDEVLSFRVSGGYASAVTVPAKDVFAKPNTLGFAEAANLLLVGTTAAQMLDAARVTRGDTILVHGASGAVGVSLLQQARLIGAHVIGTASEKNFPLVTRFGATPVQYGSGLEDRIRRLTPSGITAALDTVGADEAIDVSLALVRDRRRIISIAAFGRAAQEGYQILSGANPATVAFRDNARTRLIELAAHGQLVVPVAQTFPLAQAKSALEVLISRHPGGKLALIPET
jgi:NADPH:quinone reductase-like Zn-dependent oxidoreductase